MSNIFSTYSKNTGFVISCRQFACQNQFFFVFFFFFFFEWGGGGGGEGWEGDKTKYFKMLPDENFTQHAK